MGLQDVREVLPEMLSKIVPATRTFFLRLMSKKMRTAVENAIVDAVVVAKGGVNFHTSSPRRTTGQVERVV